MPLFNGKDAALANGPRRGEIRLADTETDDIIHGVDEVEKLADAAFGQTCDMFRNETFTDRF
jgi:hypothetical protein